MPSGQVNCHVAHLNGTWTVLGLWGSVPLLFNNGACCGTLVFRGSVNPVKGPVPASIPGKPGLFLGE